MLRKNLMSALLAAVATGAVLTAYNAFLHGTRSATGSATARLSSYLNLTKAKQETKQDENNVVGTDNATQSQSGQPNVTVTPTPSPDQAQSSAASPSTSTTPSTTPSTTTTTPQGGKAETTYTVKDGDTYGCIAEKYYGSFEHYTDIMAANPVTDTGFGEYSLYVGAVLTLPAIAKENLKPASSLCQ